MSSYANQPETDINALLAPPNARKGWRRYSRWIYAALTLVVVVLALRAFTSRRAAAEMPRYDTTQLTRGDLNVTVSATGNLAPTNKVNVGSELSGTVEDVLVEENDHVTKGQVLARLDPAKLNDAITQANATLASSKAKLAQAEAALKDAQVNLDRYREVSRLSNGKVPAKAEMTTAETTYAKAQADVANYRATVKESEAELSTAKINLSKSSLRSPINGVVLVRDVQKGQTVAAQMEVTTLFTIAEDLSQMDLKVYVDEADVGSVTNGLAATFSVDAYPNRKYNATVSRVAYGSTTTNNVVSYSTVLKVKNDDLSLRPGMTATAAIATLAHKGVLLVPNTALRFTPPQSATAKKSGFRIFPGPPGESSAKTQTIAKGSTQKVWTLQNGQPVAISVVVGATDGQVTEVTGDGLKEGLSVITNTAEQK